MPDKVSMEEMHSYGYQWDGMLPLTKERALELLDAGMELHKLYEDGTEAVVKKEDESGKRRKSKEGILYRRGFAGAGGWSFVVGRRFV